MEPEPAHGYQQNQYVPILKHANGTIEIIGVRRYNSPAQAQNCAAIEIIRRAFRHEELIGKKA